MITTFDQIGLTEDQIKGILTVEIQRLYDQEKILKASVESLARQTEEYYEKRKLAALQSETWKAELEESQKKINIRFQEAKNYENLLKDREGLIVVKEEKIRRDKEEFNREKQVFVQHSSELEEERKKIAAERQELEKSKAKLQEEKDRLNEDKIRFEMKEEKPEKKKKK